MDIIARVKEILLTPKTAWSVIETEETSTATFIPIHHDFAASRQWLFIGMSLFGVSALAFRYVFP